MRFMALLERNSCIHLFIHKWLYSLLLGPVRFFSFVILYSVGRTSWTEYQPVARPLPTHRTTQTQNKGTQTSMPWVGFEPMISVFERAKTVHAATVIGSCNTYPSKTCMEQRKRQLKGIFYVHCVFIAILLDVFKQTWAKPPEFLCLYFLTFSLRISTQFSVCISIENPINEYLPRLRLISVDFLLWWRKTLCRTKVKEFCGQSYFEKWYKRFVFHTDIFLCL
jgi:hypothetical protein